MKPTALRQEEKIANIDIAQSPGNGQDPAAATACSQPSASHGAADGGAQTGTRHRGVRCRCPGFLEEGRSPDWRPGTHTLRGSIPGADDGREEPRPGGGGAGSKPFTAPLSRNDVCPDRENFVPLLFITPQLTFPEI